MKNFQNHDNGRPCQIQVYGAKADPNNSDVQLLDCHHQPDLSLIAYKPEPRIPLARQGCHRLSSEFPKSLAQGTHRAYHYYDAFCAFDSNSVEAHQKLRSQAWRIEKHATFADNLAIMSHMHLKWHRASTDLFIGANNGQLAFLVGIWPRSVVKLVAKRFAPSRSPPLRTT
jgi:hypothetical protein